MKKKYESPLAEVLDFDVKDMLMATSNPDPAEVPSEEETPTGDEPEPED